MPHWASRVSLEVVGVKVERLQDISKEDARAEGVRLDGKPDDCVSPLHQYAFHQLWESIYEPDGFGWDTNPWVWCVTFKVITP